MLVKRYSMGGAAGNRTRLKSGKIRVEQRKDTGVITGDDPNRPGETVKQLDGVNGTIGTVGLEWKPDRTSPDPTAFLANPQGTSPWLFGGYYRIYQWKGGWAYSRPKHPQLGELDGVADTVDEAKTILEADHARQQRLRAWLNYMLANDPPLGVQ